MIYYIISIAVVSSCCEVAFGIKEYKCKWVLAGIWDLLVAADAFCTFWFLSKKSSLMLICAQMWKKLFVMFVVQSCRDLSHSGLDLMSSLGPHICFKAYHAIHYLKKYICIYIHTSSFCCRTCTVLVLDVQYLEIVFPFLSL